MNRNFTIRALNLLVLTGLWLSGFSQSPDYFSSANFAVPNSNLQSQAALMTTMGNSKILITNPNSGGQCLFKFYSSTSGGITYAPNTTTTVNPNTPISFNSNGGNSYSVNAASMSERYVFKTRGSGSPGTSEMMVFKLSALPANIVSVTQTPDINTVCNGSSVTVTATMASTTPAEQGLYLAVSTDNFVTGNVYSMSGGGTSYTATISSYSPGTTVYYKVFSSVMGLSGITMPNVDFYSINMSAPFNYTVGSPATITLQPVNSTVCEGSNTTFTVGASGTGLTYKWQRSMDGGTTFISLTDDAVFSGSGSSVLTVSGTTPAMSGNKFRCLIGCSATSVASLIVDPPLNAGTIGSPQTICYNTVPAGINQITSATGGNGTYVFQWQTSSDDVTWTNISGATTQNYSPPVLTTNTYYRRQVSSGTCGIAHTSSVLITVNPASVGGTATASNSPICSGGTSTLTLTGFTGNIQWQQSPDGTTGWTDVTGGSGTTSASYTTPALTSTTYYRALTKSGVCASANSTIASVTVNPASAGGTATASASTVCSGSSSTLALTGYTGNIQWQQSSDGTTGWTNVTGGSGATSSTYTTPTLTNTTFYRAMITSGVCASANSTTASVTVNPASTGGTATASNSPICSGTTSTLNLTGFAGNIQWQQSPDGTTGWADVIGATSATYTTPALTSTTYYRAVVTSGVCTAANSTMASVTVNSLPTVNITGIATICGGSSTTLTASGASTYLWSPATGLSSTNGASVTANPIATTTYTITGTNGNNCSNTASIVVTVNPLPAVTVTGAGTICAGGSATLSATGATSFSWSPATGLSASTGANVTASPTSTITYTITGTDNNNCSNTTTTVITVNPALSANITATDISCYGQNNGAINISAAIGGGGTYQYNDGVNGWVGSGTSHSFSNLAPGTYSNIQIRDAAMISCSTVLPGITISEPSAISASVSSNNSSCNGGNDGSATVTVTGGTVPYSYSWSPGGASTATATTLPAGTYTVTITDTKGCTKTATATITEPASLSATTTSTNVTCNGGNDGSATVTVTGGTAPYLYSWSPGGASTAAATALTAGNYTVTITDANGCTKTASATITEAVSLSATTTSTNVTCNGGNDGSAIVTVTGGTAPYSYSWSPGGASTATATALTAGNYTVTITDANGCTKTATTTITEPAPFTPTISANGPTTFCSGNKVVLSASAGTSYFWSTGVTTSSIIVSTSGSYTVTVKDNKGCLATSASVAVTVKTAPSASFTFSNSTTNTNATFNPDVMLQGTGYLWDFGDNTYSNEVAPSHSYTAAGVYTVQLNVMDSALKSCQTTSKQSVTVGAAPCVAIADFTVSQDTVNKTLSLSDVSSGSNLSWYWNFGDGTFASTQNPLHTYSKEGYYKVCLTVRDGSKGCQNVACRDIKVGSQPTCSTNFNYFTDIVSQKIQFNGNVDAVNVKYYWDFGNGDFSSETNPVYIYNRPGTYKVCLSTIDDNGCQSFACNDITAGSIACKAAFSAMSDNNSTIVNFHDASMGDATEWYWDFGDGTMSNLRNPDHNYDKAGFYHVCLTVSKAGYQDSYCSDINVGSNNCNTIFSFFTDPVQKKTDFRDLSLGQPVEWFWEFGDGQVSDEQNPSNTYSADGIYTVCLTTKNAGGCVSQYCKELTVGNIGADCQAKFESFESNGNATFKNISIGDVTSYFWDFGDQSYSTEVNPAHTYGKPGYYLVTLTIYNQSTGCFNTTAKTLVAGSSVADQAIQASYTYMANSQTNDVVFKDASLGKPVSWSWDFSDGSTSSLQNPTHKFAGPGFYHVCLTVTAANGSSSVYCTVVGIAQTGLAANFSYQESEQFYFKRLSGYPVSFYGSSYGKPSKWKWDFGDNTYDSLRINVVHLYQDPGAYKACLTISDPITKLLSSQCRQVKVGVVTGLQQPQSELLNMEVYPNPLSEKGMVSYYLNNNKKIELSLADLQGRTLKTFVSGEQGGMTRQIIDISDLAVSEGLYIIRLNIEGSIYCKPIVIRKN